MTLKKVVCTVLCCLLCLSTLTCCKNSDQQTEQPDSEVAALTGEYSSGRCNIAVSADENDQLQFVVQWSSSSNESSRWEMSGSYDSAKKRVEYVDAVSKNLVYDAEGNEIATVNYEDGTGYFEFTDDSSFIWHDNKEDVAAEMIFLKDDLEDSFGDEEEPDPVKSFLGTYRNDQCSVTVEAEKSSSVQVKALWHENDKSGFEWTLTGSFHVDTLRINYKNAIKRRGTFTSDNTFISEETVFEDGSGYLEFNIDNSMTWHDTQDKQIGKSAFYLVRDSAEPDSNHSSSTGNPIAEYCGIYQYEDCTIEIEPVNESDAAVVVDWPNSSFEIVHWEMSGRFNPDTLCINYTDSHKTIQTFTDHGEMTEEISEYEGGFGAFQLSPDHTLHWQDVQEGELVADMSFVKNLS